MLIEIAALLSLMSKRCLYLRWIIWEHALIAEVSKLEENMTGIKILVMLLRAGFLLLLGVAGWQDYKYRRIKVNVFLGFGIFGDILRGVGLVMEKPFQGCTVPGAWLLLGSYWADIGAAMGIGLLLLILSAVTREAVGRGDGWFFVVSGIYLGFWRNLELLCASLFLCLIAGGVIAALNLVRDREGSANIRKLSLPFLAFAVPAGLGVMLL